MNLTELSNRVRGARFELDAATRSLEVETEERNRLVERLENAKRAQIITQTVAKEIQDRAYGCISGIVTQCLEAVFDTPYKFRLDFVTKRGQTEALLAFERDGRVLDPVSAAGGGVVEVAAFALRLASLMLLGTRARRMLILDEPFKFLSSEYRSRIRDLLLLLADQMGIQIVMVTHIRELEVGKVVSLG